MDKYEVMADAAALDGGKASNLDLLISAGDYAGGLIHAEHALKSDPDNFHYLSIYAFCLLRLGRYQEAYEAYQSIFNAPPTRRDLAHDYWLDGLTEACGWLGRDEDVQRFGLIALTYADHALGSLPFLVLPSSHPPGFDPSRPQQNIIAYSLFGASPRYCESMVVNSRVIHELFPGWTCRVYLDDSVPTHVLKRLHLAGAEIVLIDAAEKQALPGVTWRFLVVDDPTVKRFLVRDADSLLCEREKAAVEQWLESNAWFHHIRDYFTHTELMLAGLWGGCTGVFSGMREMIGRYVSTYTGPQRFADQRFLRECLWSTVRQSLLSHDELFGFQNAQAFPPHSPMRWTAAGFHIGSNATYQQVRIPCDLPEKAILKIVVDDAEDGPRVYLATVSEGKWCLDLPFFLIEKFCKKELTLTPVGQVIEDR